MVRRVGSFKMEKASPGSQKERKPVDSSDYKQMNMKIVLPKINHEYNNNTKK
jgi:hypothetical protein